MGLSAIARWGFRLAGAFLLISGSTGIAWAQLANDTGIQFEYASGVEELPELAFRNFDSSLSPVVEENFRPAAGPGFEDSFGSRLGGPVHRDRIWFFYGDDLSPNEPADLNPELGLEQEYSFHNGLDVPLRYTHEQSETETLPPPESLSPNLGMGWDIQSHGELFGQWQIEPHEREVPEFTMGPDPLERLIDSLSDPEDESDSPYVNPPTIEPIDDGLTVDAGFRFEDEFAVHIPYGESPREPLLPEQLRGFNIPTLPVDGSPPANGGEFPSIDFELDEGVVQELRAQREWEPLGPPQPRDLVQEESDARVAVTRRFIEQGLRNSFHDALWDHAEGTGTLQAVEDAREALRSRND